MGAPKINLTKEQLWGYKERGLSNREIAKTVGCHHRTVAKAGRKWGLPECLRQAYRTSTYRAHVFRLLDADSSLTILELIELTGCKRYTADAYRRQWISIDRDRDSPYTSKGPPCTRCGARGWDTNPITDDGTCLWCWTELAGINLRFIFETLGIETALEALLA
jgi:transposase